MTISILLQKRSGRVKFFFFDRTIINESLTFNQSLTSNSDLGAGFSFLPWLRDYAVVCLHFLAPLSRVPNIVPNAFESESSRSLETIIYPLQIYYSSSCWRNPNDLCVLLVHLFPTLLEARAAALEGSSSRQRPTSTGRSCSFIHFETFVLLYLILSCVCNTSKFLIWYSYWGKFVRNLASIMTRPFPISFSVSQDGWLRTDDAVGSESTNAFYDEDTLFSKLNVAKF